MKKTIKALRLENSLTQQELGELLGVTGSCIGNYESGIRLPDLEMAVEIANLFGLKIDDIDFLCPKKQQKSAKTRETETSRCA